MADIDRSKSSGTYRAALAAVIILSVLVVAAFIAVVYGFVRQYRIYSQNHAASAAKTVPAGGSAATVQLQSGAHIISASTDAGKLVLHVTTSAGSEVDIFDLETGELTSRVKDNP